MTIAPPIITIFGATGFIGRAIVARLARTRLHGPYGGQLPLLRVVTRNLSRAEPLRMLGEVGQVTPLVGNVNDAAFLNRAVANSVAVINCIGILAESRRARFATLQGELPGKIAQAVLLAAPNARLIQLSAIGADANSPSAYARSKAAGEGVLRALYPRATILRPSVVFGPEDQFFNRFAKLALLSPMLPLFGRTDARLQPVYVEDVAAATVAVLQRVDTTGKIYELGGPATYTLRELFQLMLRLTGRHRPIVAVPPLLAGVMARVMEILPGKPLTRDQLRLLQRDNIASRQLPGMPELGIAPTALEAVLSTYLDRFRPRGRFS